MTEYWNLWAKARFSAGDGSGAGAIGPSGDSGDASASGDPGGNTGEGTGISNADGDVPQSP